MKRSPWMRLAHALACAVFTWFAALQFNDPDAAWWVMAYGGPALACARAAWRVPHPAWPALLLCAAASWSAWLAAQAWGRTSWAEMTESFKMAPGFNPAAELARESGGLLLVAAWMAVMLAHAAWTRRA